jgi:hypothetical protein
MRERRRVERADVTMRHVLLPAFDLDRPNCEAVREIAFVGGKWPREGPAPIWYRGAGMPRPEGFREGSVPMWELHDPDWSYGAYQFAWLGLCLGLGLAIGYLDGTWHGREMRAYFMMWGTFGGGIGLAAPLALVVYIVLTY